MEDEKCTEQETCICLRFKALLKTVYPDLMVSGMHSLRKADAKAMQYPNIYGSKVVSKWHILQV